MSIVTLVRREYQVSIGRGSLFQDRLRSAVLAGLPLAGCLAFWDWKGWDRESVFGARRFAEVVFGLLAGVQFLLAASFVMPAAGSIASERDKKTLDALLSTELSGFEITFGLFAATLLRVGNALLATLPMVVLLVYFGGIDPRLPMLAAVGAFSTALAMAALCVATSVESRTATRAANAATTWLHAWLFAPLGLLLFRRLLFPRAPAWVSSVLLGMVDTVPIGPVLGFIGAFPRPWSLAEGIALMAAYQFVMAAVLLAWAAWRLRPASRGLYDTESRRGIRRAWLAANRVLPGRVPCGDDPISWNERYCHRLKSRVGRVIARLMEGLALASLIYGTWLFAVPAFDELRERGYGPSPEAFRMPELTPSARVLVDRLAPNVNLPAAPGQARLEFNIILRQFTSMMAVLFVITITGYGAESLVLERRRDTWLSLLSTPLSGEEIVRGKRRGAFRRIRGVLGTLLVLWTIGLALGAIHPLGFVMVTLWLVVAGPLYFHIGIGAALRSANSEWPLHPKSWLPTLLKRIAAMMLLTAVPGTLVYLGLFSYEDVVSIVQAGPFPPLDRSSLSTRIGARGVLLLCLGLMALTVFVARGVARALARDFDSLAGRPHRSSLKTDHGHEQRAKRTQFAFENADSDAVGVVPASESSVIGQQV